MALKVETAPERLALGLITCCISEENSLIVLFLMGYKRIYVYCNVKSKLISNQLDSSHTVKELEYSRCCGFVPGVYLRCITTITTSPIFCEAQHAVGEGCPSWILLILN